MAVTTVTGRQFVTRALRMLGVIGSTDAPSAEDLADGFELLQDWMDGLKTQRKTIFQVLRNTHSLASSTQQYTIGDGATWSQERPLWIEGWGILPSPADASPQEIPMGRPMTLDQWRRIPVKGTTAAYPTSIYYDYSWADATGFGRVEVYPVPTSSTPDIVLYTPAPLAEFADIDTEYSFPPMYRRAIRYGLALDMAPEWDIDDEQKLQRIERIATSSMAWIKRANWRPKDASFDPALTGVGFRGRNIYSLE